MCLKRDRLLFSERQFNAQLAGRWQNAVHCSEQDIPQQLNKSPSPDVLEQDSSDSIRMLAQWTHSSNPEPGFTLTFDASFNQPKIVCIRENMALLFLSIKEGSRYLDVITGKFKNTIHDIQAVFVVGLVHYNGEVEEVRADRSRTPRTRVSVSMSRLTAEYNEHSTADKPLTLRYDDKEINDRGLRGSLKENLSVYLDLLVRSKNSILFNIPEFPLRPEPRESIGYRISIPRISRGYPLDDQEVDIARLNQWFNAGPWEKNKSISRKIGRFWIAFGAPQIEPLFRNTVMFTITMPSISVSNEVVIKNCEISFVIDLVIGTDKSISFAPMPPSSTSYFPSEVNQQYHQEIVDSITGDYVTQLLGGIGRLTIPHSYSPAAQSPEIGHIVGISATILRVYFERLFPSGYSEHTVPDSLDQNFNISIANSACEFKAIDPDPGNDSKIMTALRLTVTLASFSVTGGGPEVLPLTLEDIKVSVRVLLVVKDHHELSDQERRSYALRSPSKAWQGMSDAQTAHWQYVVLEYDEANAEFEMESESLAGLRNDKDHEAVQSCILLYLRTKLDCDDGSNIIHVITHTPKQDNLSNYFPGIVLLFTLHPGQVIIVVVLGLRRSLCVKNTIMVPKVIPGLILPPNPPKHSLAGLTCLTNKALFKPLWAYVNASTTIIPSAIVLRQQVPIEVKFTTWEESYGVDLQITDFSKFDWDYEGKLHFNEQLKIAKWLGLFNKWDEKDISLTVHTKNQFTVSPVEKFARLKIDCQGISNPKFKTKGSKGGKASMESPANWTISLSIGQEEGTQQLKITQGHSDQHCSMPGLPLQSFDCNAHSRIVENFTKLSFDNLNQELNDMVDQACKAAGAEECHKRTYSFNKQGDLVVHFGPEE